jgi:hypothetical protein
MVNNEHMKWEMGDEEEGIKTRRKMLRNEIKLSFTHWYSRL